MGVVLEWTTSALTSVRGMTVIPLYMLSKPTHTAFFSALARKRSDVGTSCVRLSLYLGEWLSGHTWLWGELYVYHDFS